MILMTIEKWEILEKKVLAQYPPWLELRGYQTFFLMERFLP